MCSNTTLNLIRILTKILMVDHEFIHLDAKFIKEYDKNKRIFYRLIIEDFMSTKDEKILTESLEYTKGSSLFE